VAGFGAGIEQTPDVTPVAGQPAVRLHVWLFVAE
jgi:hypothetical protein